MRILILELNLNNYKLPSTETHIGHLSIKELKAEIEECQDDINDLRQKQLRMKFSVGTKVEAHYQSKIQIILCKYFLAKSERTENLELRNIRYKLIQLLQRNS